MLAQLLKGAGGTIGSGGGGGSNLSVVGTSFHRFFSDGTSQMTLPTGMQYGDHVVVMLFLDVGTTTIISFTGADNQDIIFRVASGTTIGHHAYVVLPSATQIAQGFISISWGASLTYSERAGAVLYAVNGMESITSYSYAEQLYTAATNVMYSPDLTSYTSGALWLGAIFQDDTLSTGPSTPAFDAVFTDNQDLQYFGKGETGAGGTYRSGATTTMPSNLQNTCYIQWVDSYMGGAMVIELR